MSTTRTTSSTPTRSRRLLTLGAALAVLGGAGIIIGTFLVWLRTPRFTALHLNHRIFYSFYLRQGTTLSSTAHASRLLTSAGIVLIPLGILAVVGAFVMRGWLSAAAGLLGIVAVVLFVVTVKGANVHPRLHLHKEVGVGAILVLVGSLLALAGGVVEVLSG
jgi:hypothetical protein